LQKKPINIETALIYGESDRFYHLIDPDADITDNEEDGPNSEKNDVVGLSVINI